MTLSPVFRDCLESLAQQDYTNTLIHIIDNNSNDSSIEYIKNKYPSYKITLLNENSGYVAHNTGIELMFKYNAKYILLMNNDILLNSNYISTIVQYMENNENIGIGSGIMYFHSKPDYINSTGICINKTAFSCNRDYGRCSNDTHCRDNISAVSGGCMIVRDIAVKATGLFDTAFESYYEDADLCLRVQTETDMEIGVCINAVSFHAVSSSWNHFPKKKDYLVLRNQYMLIFKLFPFNMIVFSKIYFLKTRLFKRNFIHIKIILYFLFHMFPLLVKRFRHMRMSRHKIAAFLISDYKPFNIEKRIIEYAEIYECTPEMDKLESRIIFGINDNVLGYGWTLLSSDYPKGRYICKKATVFLKNNFKKYVKIHGFGNGNITLKNRFTVNGFFTIFEYNESKADIVSLTLYSEYNIKIIEIELTDEKM